MEKRVIYEVNASVDPGAVEQYGAIVKHHIDVITKLPGFTGAEWFERQAKDETQAVAGRVHWTMHFHAKDRQSLDNYLNGIAPKLRAETQAMGERVVVFRRILTLKG